MKRSLFAIALLICMPAMAQIPPDIANTLIIVNVQRDDSFGCQSLETLLAIASSFTEVENITARNRILASLLRTGECSRFIRGEQLYDVTVSPGVHMVRRLKGGPVYYAASY